MFKVVSWSSSTWRIGRRNDRHYFYELSKPGKTERLLGSTITNYFLLTSINKLGAASFIALIPGRRETWIFIRGALKWDKLPLYYFMNRKLDSTDLYLQEREVFIKLGPFVVAAIEAVTPSFRSSKAPI